MASLPKPIFETAVGKVSPRSGTIAGSAIWDAGVSRNSGGMRSAGEATFNVRVYRAELDNSDTPWGGTIDIYSTDNLGVRVKEGSLGDDTGDSVGPLGTYPLRLVRGLVYEFEGTFATTDHIGIQMRIQVWP